MKRFLFLLFVVFAVIPSYSQLIKLDHVAYRLNDSEKTAEITNEQYDPDDPSSGRIEPFCYIGDIVIPAEITYNNEKYRVTSMVAGAFAQCQYLNSVVLPNTITTISVGAFHFCTGLTSVTIPNGVTNIGEGAFSICSSLASVIIPNGVTNIGEEAFYDCSSLASVIIPNSVTSIGNMAFLGCESLTSVTIPNSVENIGSQAFWYCGLTSVTIPNSVKTMGEEAFNAEKIIFNCAKIENEWFGNNRFIKDVLIGEEVNSIGEKAFYCCVGLNSIVVEIGNAAYDSRDNCNALIETKTGTLIAGCKNSFIPNGVTRITSGAFVYQDYTDLYCYTDNVPDNFDKCYDFDVNISEITLHVHDYALEAFKNLELGFKDITVFEKVTDFNLTYYVDGEVYKQYKHKYEDPINPEPSPTKKGMTFSGWSEVPEKMPAHDVTVSGSFSWSKLTKDGVVYEIVDTLNNHCKVIGNDNASGEIKIESVEIDGCFYQPTEIADKAFYGCKNITKIEIPATVTTIGERAFANIDKLTDVTIWAEEIPTTDRTAFENSYIDYATLQVPVSALEKYKAAAPWSGFKSVVAIGGTEPKEKCATPTVEYVNGHFFFDCETEGVEYNYKLTTNDVKEGKAEAVKINFMYTMTVYASKEGYEDSNVAVYEFDIRGKKGDVNADGDVNVGDIVTVTNIMSGKDD